MTKANLLLFAFLSATLYGQEFDAASVKPSAASGERKSMNSDSGRITYVNVSLRDCLMAAYARRIIKYPALTGWVQIATTSWQRRAAPPPRMP